VTLTRQELSHIARLIKAGKIMPNDAEPESRRLRAMMSKLDVDTSGLKHRAEKKSCPIRSGSFFGGRSSPLLRLQPL
jgi:hypothetical protein